MKSATHIDAKMPSQIHRPFEPMAQLISRPKVSKNNGMNSIPIMTAGPKTQTQAKMTHFTAANMGAS